MADTDNLLNDDNDDLDREVESCLTGAGHGVSSPSSCSFYSDQGDSSDSASFYSTATGHESTMSDTDSFYSTGTLVNDSDTASFYSTATMVMSDGEDTLSYCSVDTLSGAKDTEDERDAEEEAGDHATDDTTPPPALTSASVTGSRVSLSSDDGGESVSSEVSVAGQLNRRLGLLLGYNDVSALSLEQDSSGSGGGLTANIMGYEIICGAGDKHTVGKAGNNVNSGEEDIVNWNFWKRMQFQFRCKTLLCWAGGIVWWKYELIIKCVSQAASNFNLMFNLISIQAARGSWYKESLVRGAKTNIY